MKKNLLMLALVVSATSFANVSGNFKVDTEHTTPVAGTFVETVKATKNTVNLSTEVKLGESGVTLGGNVKFDNDILKKTNERKLNEFNANAKYDFTTGVEGLKAHIKGNVGASNVTAETANVNLKGEAGVSYEKDGLTYALNSNTATIIMVTDKAKSEFVSEHEAKLSGEKGKIKDILLRAKVAHNYDVGDTGEALVEVEGKAGVEVAKNTVVSAHDLFVVAAKASTKETEGTIIGGKKPFASKGHLYNQADLKVAYKDDVVEASATGLVEYRKTNDKELGVGVKLDAKYKGVKNLELSGDALFAGKYGYTPDTTKGMVKLGVQGKYEAKVNDKLTLTPALKLNADFTEITKTNYEFGASIAPKLDTAFQASKEVKLTNSLESKFSFDKGGYTQTNLTAKLGLEYKF